MPADVGSVELSVVVAFHDAAPHLRQQLGALARQEFDGGWEVIADDEVAPGYLAAMSKALEVHEFVTARLDHETLNPIWVRSAYGSRWQQMGVDTYFGFLPFASGCALGVSRRVFEDVGGFREELSPAHDVAFSWDVQLAGTALHFVADAVLRYRYRDSLSGLFRQTRRQGSVTPLLYKRYREMGCSGESPLRLGSMS
jgi:hypothetical protein